MITITLNNITNLNVSLQVGDLIYAKSTSMQDGAEDREQSKVSNSISPGSYAQTNLSGVVGILRRIDILGDVTTLFVDEAGIGYYAPMVGDFLMFSKYNQSMGDLIGYYAKARFVNNSKEKAEIFSVGSEVIINSK